MDAINLRRAIADAETLLNGPDLGLAQTAARTSAALRNLLAATKELHGDGRPQGIVYVVTDADVRAELYVQTTVPLQRDLAGTGLDAYEAVIDGDGALHVDGA
jgi:hypothetical protein